MTNSSYSDFADSECDEDTHVPDDELEEQTFGEIRAEIRISSAIENHNDGSLVFSEADLELWKQQGRVLMERYKDGYYRSKDKHGEVYEELLTLYAPCITEKALAMLAHPFSTQTNRHS